MLLFLGAAIGLGGSLLSGLFGAGGPSREERALMDQQTRQGRTAERMVSEMAPEGRRLINRAVGTMAPATRYYTGLLSGDRGTMTETLAPEIGKITDAYRSARESEAMLRPRGGGRATILSSLPYQQARDISTLFQGVRPQAAQGLMQAGQQYGTLGTSTLQNAINSLYAATSSGRSNLDALNAIRQREAEQSRSLGRAIYDIGQGVTGMFSGGRPKISSIFAPEGGPMTPDRFRPGGTAY